MKHPHYSKLIAIFTLIALAGFAAIAFADPGNSRYGKGWGADQRACDNYGPGYGRWSGARGGFGPNELTDEQAQKLEETRNAFYEETKDLNQDIHQKRLELRAELAKKEPEAKKASALQKEISDLESQLDQKRLGHHLKMKEVFPDLAERGLGYHHRGHGPNTWRGYHGRCW